MDAHSSAKVALGSESLTVELRLMTEADFRAWQAEAIPGYAADKVKNGAWTTAEAEGLSREAFAKLLPQGLATPGQHLLAVQEKDAKQTVGYLWYAVQGRRAFLFDIVIHAEARSRGLGRQAMLALEEHARQQGLEAIELHVFGHNEIARELYLKLGYGVTDLNLRKWLGDERKE